MFFKKNDILVLKNSVEGGRAYDGVFLDHDMRDVLRYETIIVDYERHITRNGRDTQYVYVNGIEDVEFPSSIFNKVGEMLDTMQVNDTHYFRSKKTYDSLTDYLLDD